MAGGIGHESRPRRMTVMCLCMILILAGPALAMPQGDISVIVLLCLMAAGTAAFMANYFSFTQEVSSRHTGLVAGYLGGLGNLFVAAYLPFAGALRDWTGSFTANFVIVGLAPLVGITVLVLGWGHARGGGESVFARSRGAITGLDDVAAFWENSSTRLSSLRSPVRSSGLLSFRVAVETAQPLQ